MSEKRFTYKQNIFKGERALFNSNNIAVYDSIFTDGESPLKESEKVIVRNSQFEWKYPFWYCKDIDVKDSIFLTMARAGIWYTDNITITDTVIQAPKQFRRCNGIELENVHFSDAAETMWNCKNITMKNVNVDKGDYFAMNCSDMDIEGLTLDGNYAFDGAKNVTVKKSKLLTKDAFWNAEDITIIDSYIIGEYFGWNSKNVKLVNCTIESLQGFCYMDNIILENCTLLNTTLAFEYSKNINADVNSNIKSIVNPISGKISAKSIYDCTINEFAKSDGSYVDFGDTYIVFANGVLKNN